MVVATYCPHSPLAHKEETERERVWLACVVGDGDSRRTMDTISGDFNAYVDATRDRHSQRHGCTDIVRMCSDFAQ